MPLRLIFMGTPDFAVPTLLELVAHGHEIAAVYTRAAKPAGRGMKLQPTPVEQEARRLGIPVFTPATLKTPEAQEQFRAHQCRRRRGRRLWHDPAAGHSRRPKARLLQSARLAVAALARCCADQPRHHGGRYRDRRDGDEDGCRPRYRRCRDGRAHRDYRCDDRGRSARRAGAARRRSDGARDRRAGTRQAAAHQTERSEASPTPPKSKRPRRGSTGTSRRAPCCAIFTGCRRFPARGAKCRSKASLRASRSCAARWPMAQAHPARCSTIISRLPAGKARLRILELQRAGKAPMKAEEFLRGTPLKPPMRLT